jgi:hypothetical protein
LKKELFIIVFAMLSLAGWAQKPHVLNLTNFDNKKVHFGFTLGMNVQDFRLAHWAPIGQNPDFEEKVWNNPDGQEVSGNDTVRADVATLNPGLTVGVVTNFRLGEYFDLRFLPGLSFGERRLVYTKNREYLPVYDFYGGTTDLQYVSVKTTYIDLPVLVKYKSSRLNNQRPYIIGGFAYRINISKTGEEDLLQLKKGNLFLEAGVGLDSYLTFFRFSTELKVSLGLNNLLGEKPTNQRGYYSEAIQSIYANIFTLSFHFE